MHGPRDQPRGCGDHEHFGGLVLPHQGPTPRVRGPRGGREGRRSMWRTNPAGAGTTPAARDEVIRARDQPRGCGDHNWYSLERHLEKGPTPRVRGPRVRAHRDAAARGTNPAGAGTTQRDGSLTSHEGDQPRGCGDHLWEHAFRPAFQGPTPRVRGPQVMTWCFRRWGARFYLLPGSPAKGAYFTLLCIKCFGQASCHGTRAVHAGACLPPRPLTPRCVRPGLGVSLRRGRSVVLCGAECGRWGTVGQSGRSCRRHRG